jgi:hypothetical protein
MLKDVSCCVQGWDVEKAHAFLAEARQEIREQEATAAAHRAGMAIFSIPHPDYKELLQTQQV